MDASDWCPPDPATFVSWAMGASYPAPWVWRGGQRGSMQWLVSEMPARGAERHVRVKSTPTGTHMRTHTGRSLAQLLEAACAWWVSCPSQMGCHTLQGPLGRVETGCGGPPLAGPIWPGTGWDGDLRGPCSWFRPKQPDLAELAGDCVPQWGLAGALWARALDLTVAPTGVWCW